MNESRESLLRYAEWLAILTIAYNVIEGVISIYLGIEDETITLLGFGVDSFVEVISGLGIWYMVAGMRREKGDTWRFERRALRVTGVAFYLLTAGLVAVAVLNLYTGHSPETTIWGVVISSISIAIMWWMIREKTKVGKALGSDAIIADANCSRACMHFSIVLLIASAAYELTGIGGIDSLGALAIAYLAFKEGREALQKAKGGACCSCSSCH